MDIDSEEAVSAIVREGRPVRPVGSGTKSRHGPRPAEAERVSLRKLNRITSYEPGDLVLCVQAGARLADVQAELAKHGQWLPIDPPYAEATIGGILATNSSGPRRLAYGTMRDLLIGTRTVGADGGVTRSGGRVVKNVTGYDLHKLHIGAFGTLGIVVEANFKVRPRPEVSAAIVFARPTFPEAHKLALDIYASKLRPAALEALGGAAAARFSALVPGMTGGAALAIVGVEGTRRVLDRHLHELGGAQVFEDGRAWNGFRDLPEKLEGFVRVRIGAKPHDLARLIPDGAGVSVHVGTGIARVDLEPAEDLPKRIAEWNEKAAAVGGYAVAESAPDFAARERMAWGPAGNALMKSIRQSADPKAILNPGGVCV